MKKITILTAVLMTVLSSAAQNNIPEILESVEKKQYYTQSLKNSDGHGKARQQN